MHRSIHRNLAAATLLVGLTTSSPAETFHLSLEDGRIAARQAVLSGQFELARDFAQALLNANTDDRAALIVLAAAQPQLGSGREGRLAGARAYRLSDTPEDRYEAARLTALAAANEERYTLSQVWLRRAAANAPDDRAYRQTQTDYRGIRRLNPLSVSLGFSIAPSNNVNGGSETELNIIDGLPFVGVLSGDAQALPGVSATADVRLAYAISRGPAHRTSVTGRAYARAVWLSDAAHETSPTSENSDFGSQRLELGLRDERRLAEGFVTTQATVGSSWFGGVHKTNYINGILSYGQALTPQTRAEVTSEVQRTDLQGRSRRSNLRRTLSTKLAYRAESGNRTTLQLSHEEQISDSPNERYEAVTARLSYAFADPVGPFQLSASLGASRTHYADYRIIFKVPDGRTDTRWFGSLSAVVDTLEYAGFVPVATLGVQDTQSNVSRFQTSEYSLNIGIRSSF
ncbi:surface lipoprotein assembly modifier [Thalassorhabdomicrobium marinisediminis]|uniref:surface lipoprotein assembly modifier n=1 Tax=Thalassorhabdomicrobium marinisediminis TaxID=2170577 RepID=UPI001304B5B6|nr:surface lipoprotein assembly modifier [Thalassorhabdomicrobium marinisediminis]